MKKIVIAVVALASSTLVMAANGTGVVLSSTMDGANVPGGGDANGQGVFYASTDAASGSLCYKMNIANVSGATVAHIHEGGAGSPGRPVVSLSVNGNQCTVVDPAVIQNILADPADYYVDVLSTSYPQGALRGQLVVG